MRPALSKPYIELTVKPTRKSLLNYKSQIATDIEPGISLKFLYDNNWLRFEIEFSSGQFIIYIPCDMVTPYSLIEATLLESLSFTKDGSLYIKKSTPGLIESTVLELGDKLAATPSP